MSYLIVNREYNVIVGVTDATYASFTNIFVEANEQQIERYEHIQSSLPSGWMVELSDIIPVKQSKPEESAPVASPEFRQSVADMFKSKPNRGKTK